MLDFLKPTKQKVVGTIIVLIALFLGSFINEAIANQMIPKELLTPDLENAVKDMVGSDTKAFVTLGLKILAINILVNISIVYLSICLIFKQSKGRA